jgi:hypothetical protein
MFPSNLIVRARCPRCSRNQRVNTLGHHKCIGCDTPFLVNPINKPSRITFVSDMELLNKFRHSQKTIL